MFKIYDGRDSFYQWDTERKLIVNDASITEVHFSDVVDSVALVCEVYDFEGVRVANVPNILLQTEWKINAYAFTDKHTKVSASFKVLPRSKPSDYVYTETEVKTYEEIIEKVNSLPFKELVTKQNYYLQELEEGIYTVTNEGTTSNTTVILGTNDNKLTMKKGSILIVSNNTTISNINRSFKKHFIALISHTVPNSNYIKSGELYCKSVTVEGIKDWEYELTWGDLLHSGNIAEYVENVLEDRLEEVAESIEETVESILQETDNKLEALKKDYIPYKLRYDYELAEFKDKFIMSNSNAPMYALLINKYDGYINIKYQLAIAQKIGAKYPVEYLINTPLEIVVTNPEDNYPKFRCTNTNIVTGCGIEGEEGEIINFNEAFDGFIEDGVIDRYTFNCNASGISGSKQVGVIMNYDYNLYAEEEILNMILEEFKPIIEAYQDKLVVWFENVPQTEIIVGNKEGTV